MADLNSMKQFALLFALASGIYAQTSPPDLNGIWVLSGAFSTNVVIRFQIVGKDGLSGQAEIFGQPPRPITGRISPGSPNPNVLSVNFDVHTEVQDVPAPRPLIVHWAAYTASPDLLIGVSVPHGPDGFPPGETSQPGGWTAARFKATPGPAPVVTPSAESVKLDQLAASVDKLQAMLQAVLDQLEALKPAPVAP